MVKYQSITPYDKEWVMKCLYCDDTVHPERVELGYKWCTSAKCVSYGLSRTNRIVLVCGHKSIYQPMFISQVAKDAGNPKRS